MGLFVRYIDWDKAEQADRIITSPGTMFEPEILAATLVWFLAKRVLKAFAIVPDPDLEPSFAKVAQSAQDASAPA